MNKVIETVESIEMERMLDKTDGANRRYYTVKTNVATRQCFAHQILGLNELAVGRNVEYIGPSRTYNTGLAIFVPLALKVLERGAR